MVLGGSKTKLKSRNIRDLLERSSAKMAPTPSSQQSTLRSAKTQRHTQCLQEGNSESDLDGGNSYSVIQSGMFKQFERMLQRALKQTSDQITDKLIREIKELGHRTAELEGKVDELENHTQDYTAEMENLKEQNLVLQTQLEDQENRDRRSNLRIKGSLKWCLIYKPLC